MTKEEALEALSDDDRAQLTAALAAWKAEGDPDPRIPLDYDIDGDGRLDAWALDENGELTLVSVESVEETVYVADGTGVEVGP